MLKWNASVFGELKSRFLINGNIKMLFDLFMNHRNKNTWFHKENDTVKW